MIKVNKKEVEWLRKNGVPDHEDGISRTLGGTYYLCESKANLSKLKEYRDSITICTVCGK